MRRKNTHHASSSHVDLSGHRNPLVRRSDRIQSRVKSTVVALAIIMLPVSAWFAMATLSSQQDRVHAQQFSRHSVTAITTSDASAVSPMMQSDVGSQSITTADASWTHRGVEHSDQVPVTAGSPIGTEVPVWVDNSGARSTQPISNADAVAAALFTGIGSLFAVYLILYGTYAALRFHLDNRRDADWDLAIKNFLDENTPR